MAAGVKRKLIRALLIVAETADSARDKIDAATLAAKLMETPGKLKKEDISPAMARLLDKGKDKAGE